VHFDDEVRARRAVLLQGLIIPMLARRLAAHLPSLTCLLLFACICFSVTTPLPDHATPHIYAAFDDPQFEAMHTNGVKPWMRRWTASAWKLVDNNSIWSMPSGISNGNATRTTIYNGFASDNIIQRSPEVTARSSAPWFDIPLCADYLVHFMTVKFIVRDLVPTLCEINY
jgi:hypothetical protein